MKYFKYRFAYENFFRLDQAAAQNQIDALVLAAPVQQSPNPGTASARRLPITWGHLKK
ncbi:MAG: hypothetical protein OXH00_17850 [Candidatus Poribacteria bacterium]|nr:hypothetical protein [Candidatus Poribacteria bacterium]